MKKPHNLKIELYSSSSSEKASPYLDSDQEEFFDYYECFKIENITCGEVSTKRCGRISMEDRFQAIADFDGKHKQFYFGVFDGHGGSYVAKILREKLHSQLKNNTFFETNIEKAIQECFQKMNADILNQQTVFMRDGGSTALCVINVGTEIFVINVGDSACVLINKDQQIQKLNREHKPDREDETQRILDNNGYVIAIKQQARINGELAVSRSFGDPRYIESGLTAVPEITKVTIDQNSQYLILATDGFWDVIDLNQLQQLIIKWNSFQESEGLSQFLLETALSKQTNYKKDNMTMIVVDLSIYYKNLK